MKRSTLLTSTAIGLFLSATAAGAQMKEEKATPNQPAQSEKGAQPKDKSAQQGESSEPKSKGAEPKQQKDKGTAEKSTEPKDKAKGSAEKAPEPKDKSTKGQAEKAPEPKDKSTKGTAEKAEPKDKGKGSAEKAPEPKDKGTKGAESSSGGNKVQLTEEKRTNVGQTLSKEGNLNRANSVNVTVNIGTRLPRSVRLVALPASIIAIVPEYRSYHYVVVEDRICIVEPSSYEIVEVIPISGQTASRSGGSSATLVLTADERRVILAEIDMSGGSTMGLGAISEGTEVPRNVKLQKFSGTIVQKVPKVEGYQYFTAEDRVAIVDPQGEKVQLVIENKR